MFDHDKLIIDVGVGQMIQGQRGTILSTGPLGTCIGILAYHAATPIGLLTHVMLPGLPPRSMDNDTRYAVAAIDQLVAAILSLGLSPEDFDVCLAGAANVLQRENCTIREDNIASVMSTLEEKHFHIIKTALHGTIRRQLRFDISTAQAFLSVGDGPFELFHTFNPRQHNDTPNESHS